MLRLTLRAVLKVLDKGLCLLSNMNYEEMVDEIGVIARPLEIYENDQLEALSEGEERARRLKLHSRELRHGKSVRVECTGWPVRGH